MRIITADLIKLTKRNNSLSTVFRHQVERHVSDAISLGAKLVVGGNRKIAGKLFYEPTLLAEVNSEMMCGREEIFGPVAPIFRSAVICFIL